MRPVLQLGHVVRGAAVAHSAAVVLDGRAVLVAGWSESGKTETALALMEDGARFLSDKWTVLAPDGTARVFPIGVGVRGWTLAHLPRLDAALGKAARRRLSVAAAARRAGRRCSAAGPPARSTGSCRWPTASRSRRPSCAG